MSRVACVALSAAFAATTAAGSAAAQTIRGELISESDGRPVARGFVVLLDSAGREVARTLTDTRGRFDLVVPTLGSYRLQSAIIGWQSWTSPLIRVESDAEIQYRMVVPLQRVLLGAVVIRGERKCGTPSGGGLALTRVWEEARKGLSAVSWTQREVTLRYQLRHHERELDPKALRVQSERFWPSAAYSRRSPFVTEEPESLTVAGYVRRDSLGGWIFHAPDADVLLSEDFAGDHCFALTESSDNPSLIGLEFQPVPDKDVPDIRGVIWLDRETAQLQYLEFHYSHLPWQIDDRDVGGYVRFQRLPNGAWIVTRWWIRMPKLGLKPAEQLGGLRLPERIVLAGIVEEGGAVTDIRYPDGTAVKLDETASLAGVVFDSTDMRPLEGAQVTLLGTPYAARTDAEGAFSLTELPPGPYQIAVEHEALNDEPYPMLPREVILAPGETLEVSLATKGFFAAWEEFCPEASIDTTGIVAGVVRFRDSRRYATQVAVRISWNEWTVISADVSRAIPRDETVTTDLAGNYRACGLPPGARVTVEASAAGWRSDPLEVSIGAAELKRVDLELRQVKP
ncbi:MAG: carboxypeptidase regulatory-like domain-containing protein [Gemmatimonadales bacterium]